MFRTRACVPGGGGRGLPGGPGGGSRLQTTRLNPVYRLLSRFIKIIKKPFKNEGGSSQGGAAELVVGELEGSLGGLGGVLGGLGVVLGWSWAVLGG